MFNNGYNGRCDILLYISFLFLRIEHWVFLEEQFQGNNYLLHVPHTDWNLRSSDNEPRLVNCQQLAVFLSCSMVFRILEALYLEILIQE
ncbi:hypothetical protein LENED_001027 [Lentinula edodes]|uniref:Uncharacterized protein n=1 Tax=Lentinula edodes TaxID=5353 RepID=A0A1Q3DXK2_LENED|nr:hypothetical protein LENED_001027 [Lentinula edodes]